MEHNHHTSTNQENVYHFIYPQRFAPKEIAKCRRNNIADAQHWISHANFHSAQHHQPTGETCHIAGQSQHDKRTGRCLNDQIVQACQSQRHRPNTDHLTACTIYLLPYDTTHAHLHSCTNDARIKIEQVNLMIRYDINLQRFFHTLYYAMFSCFLPYNALPSNFLT